MNWWLIVFPQGFPYNEREVVMRVLVGMSGGIDSSVAAYLLKKQGFDVVGVTMMIYSGKRNLPVPTKHMNSCYTPLEAEELPHIKEIAEKIGIEHVTVDLSDLYDRTIIADFQQEYLSGHTPNPCVWCNAKMKFGAMVDYAREQGLSFDKFATGHYARIVQAGKRWCLERAVDLKKDQSYFLYRLSQLQLSSTMFPLGGMLKSEVRKIDEELGFHPAGQDESQDFYSGDYTDLLDVQDKPGDIVMRDGKVVGRHEGIWHYTIGQRKGLGIAAPRPLYVLALDPKKNQVVVGYEEETVDIEVTAGQVNWQMVDHFEGKVPVSAKIRSTGSPMEAEAWENPDGTVTCRFKSPVKAATPGQSLVMYQDDKVLAGGIISSVS